MRRIWQRGTCRHLVFLLVSISGLYSAAQTKTSANTGNRYLYILDCGSTLEKFDILSRKKVSTVDLEKHTGMSSMHSDKVISDDGCFNYGGVYQAKTSMLYTLVPTEANVHKDVRYFRIVSVHIPGLQTEVPIKLPGRYSYGDSPTLTIDRSGLVGVIDHNRYSRITGGQLISATRPGELPGSHPPTSDDASPKLDLSVYHSTDIDFAGRTDQLSYHSIEGSGDTVLIQVPLSGQGWTWTVVDAAAHRLIRINLPFNFTDTSVHLAPGGKIILAQEAAYSPAGISMTKGRLALMDAGTGSVIRTWDDPAVIGKNILTVTPEGEMVVVNDESTVLTSIDIHPSDEPVIDLRRHSLGPYFFMRIARHRRPRVKTDLTNQPNAHLSPAISLDVHWHRVGRTTHTWRHPTVNASTIT